VAAWSLKISAVAVRAVAVARGRWSSLWLLHFAAARATLPSGRDARNAWRRYRDQKMGRDGVRILPAA